MRRQKHAFSRADANSTVLQVATADMKNPQNASVLAFDAEKYAHTQAKRNKSDWDFDIIELSANIFTSYSPR